MNSNTYSILAIIIALILSTGLKACDPAEDNGEPAVSEETELVIMSTADLHGYVRAWDYYRDEGNLGYSMSRAATLVDSVRAEHEHTLLLDAGDWLQGNSFAEYFATEAQDDVHYPLLAAADLMDFDALVLGNHEFDYGLDYLNRQIDLTETPIIGANMYHHATEEPAYPPYIMRELDDLNVAIIGLNTPGTAVWNRPRVEGELDFRDGDEVAERFVQKVREEENADVVIVLAHSAYDGDDSYSEEGVGEENFGKTIADNVDGVDALVLGHRHRTFEKVRENVGGSPLAVIESGRWGDHLGVIELRVTNEDGSSEVVEADTRMHQTAHAEEHAEIVDLVEDEHEDVREYVNQPVVFTDDTWTTEDARREQAPAIELIQRVQLERTGAQLSAAAAFNTNVEFGPGEVRLGDIALLYPFENTLYKMELTGDQIREFLEYTSQYYLKPEDGELQTNPEWPGFNYDMLSGVEYELDLRNEPGERITNLTYDGEPVERYDTFTVAINSYRAVGGGGFDMLEDAEVIEVIDLSVRNMIIEYLKEKEEVSASDYKTDNWRLIY